MPVAALIHDPGLGEDPELLQAVVAAAGLALENERLQAELRAKLEELRASRARIVQAGDSERRRLERNLHDGAQQRLLALSFSLGLAESQPPDGSAEAAKLAHDAKEEVVQAIEELRELARGIHPTILTDRGLAVALQTVAARSPVPVALSVDPERLPEPIETAAYYLVSEAIANATKHAAREPGRRHDRARERQRGNRGRRRRCRRRQRPRRIRSARPRRPRRSTRRYGVRHQPRRRRYDHPRRDPMRVVVADDSVLLREGLVHILTDGRRSTSSARPAPPTNCC